MMTNRESGIGVLASNDFMCGLGGHAQRNRRLSRKCKVLGPAQHWRG